MDFDTASDRLRHDRGRVTRREKEDIMNILLIIIGVIAVVLLLTGGFVQSLNFLLWVGLVLAIIAVIIWLIRVISGRRTTV
jgi:small-conductance mechanosensitive channel